MFYNVLSHYLWLKYCRGCLIWIANGQNMHFVQKYFLFYYFERWTKYLRLGNRKNWHACPAVLWIFCPPNLRAGHVTESYELNLQTIFFLRKGIREAIYLFFNWKRWSFQLRAEQSRCSERGVCADLALARQSASSPSYFPLLQAGCTRSTFNSDTQTVVVVKNTVYSNCSRVLA